ncbi:MAG: GNAT family N-acetyltransferase [Bacteroidales bacterium]|jgi:RimJ/RimL family protein N-acetyltransferase/pimeloyl-ACP methyl ester carboxylesterase|nr:GNAT family N-acetyltransferase [Bacteroidales bacterium]
MAFFTFENKKVYFKEIGTGEPILLLAGNTASSKMFKSIIGKYSKDFRVILIDFPGHGKSERLETFEVDFWHYNSKVCYQLIDFLKFDKVSVIGTSGGALAAINLALEHPERINYLIADSFEGEYPLTSYMDSLESDREKGKKNIFAKLFWFENHGFDWKKIVDLDTEMLVTFSKLGKSFFHKSISKLTVPTLLTGSKADEYCDSLDKIYEALKWKNDTLEIHMFEKGKHPAMLTNKNDFYEIVKKKINRTSIWVDRKIIIGKDGDVILRELIDSDLEKLAVYANNEKVSINLRDGFPKPYTIENARSFKKMIDSQNPKTFFAIEYQNDYVGNISLSLGTDVYRKSAEIGYFIGEPFWNKGIATKAVNIITEWGFNQFDIVRIYTGVFEYNQASQRVLNKCGFVKEAIFKKSICKNNKIFDEIRFAKIKE